MAIAFDNSDSAISKTVAHSITGSGNDRVLIAFYHCSGSNATASECTDCTYDGVSADGSFYVGEIKWSNSYGVTAFYWLESSLPTNSGSYNCVATTGSGVWNFAGITMSFTGVDQSALADFSNSDNDGGLVSELSVTTSEDNSMSVSCSAFYAGSTSTSITPADGQTEVEEVSQNAQGKQAGGYHALASSGTHDQDWDYGASVYAYVTGAFILESAGGAATPKCNMLTHNF